MSILIQSSADFNFFAKKLSELSGVPRAPIRKALSTVGGAQDSMEYECYLDNFRAQKVRDDINSFLSFFYENELSPLEIHQQVEVASPSTYPCLKSLKNALDKSAGDSGGFTRGFPFPVNGKKSWLASLTLIKGPCKGSPFVRNGRPFSPVCELCKTIPVYKESPGETHSAAVMSGIAVSVKETCTLCYPIVNMDTSDDAKFMHAFSLNPSYSQGNISALLFQYEVLQIKREKEALESLEEKAFLIMKVFFEDVRKQFSVLESIVGRGFVQSMFAISKYLSSGPDVVEYLKLEQKIYDFHSIMTVMDGRRIGLPPHIGESGFVINNKEILDRVAKTLSENTNPGREKWKGIIANAAGFNKVSSLITEFEKAPILTTLSPPDFSEYMAEMQSSYTSEQLHKYMVEILTTEDKGVKSAIEKGRNFCTLISTSIKEYSPELLEVISPYKKGCEMAASTFPAWQRETTIDYKKLITSGYGDNHILVIGLGKEDEMKALLHMIDTPELFASLVGASSLEWMQNKFLAARRSRIDVTTCFIGGSPSLSTLRYYVKNYAKSQKAAEVLLSQLTPCPSNSEVLSLAEKFKS